MVMMKLVLVVVTLITFLVNVSFALYLPYDNYLIACGSSKSINFQDRVFVPDSHVLKTENSIVVASSNSSVVPSPIYQSARIFSENGSYRFDVLQGTHWIRLYFYPIPNTSHNLTSASIKVVTDDFVLLNNFSFRNYNGSYMFREYAINVISDTLTVTFIPLHGSVAFVNAIEVVPMPYNLFIDQTFSSSPFAHYRGGLLDHAFETVYRLNIGGTLLTAENDTLGRTWENDQKYLHVNSSVTNVSATPSRIRYPSGVTNETAPNWVYATAEAMGSAINPNFNITWVFDVDPRFSYFVRLHFCDIISKEMNTLVFNVFINANIAIGSFDLSSLTNDLAVPYYKNFVSNASSDNTLTVSIGPDALSDSKNATLNGLEIMKISNAFKSLDGSGSDGSGSSNKHIIVVVAVVIVVVLTLLVLLVAGIQYYRKKKKLPGENSEDAVLENLASMPIRFCYKDLEVATNNFSLKLGKGGFGSVYKGVLTDGTELAVKQLEGIGQGKKEFRAEISIIGSIHHLNLVRLKGFCADGTHRLLVYEYMANNSLDKWIFKKKKSEFLLDWDTRFNIALGTAKGLAYLHEECDSKIVHCDIKPENILLDDHFIAKVSDFGLAKLMSRQQTHVFTTLRGTRGYLAPEWIRNCPISEKSDVYSYGMVLLEIISGRKNYDPNETSEKSNFPCFAFKMMEEGKVRDIVDSELKIDDEHDDKVHCAISVALWCIQENMCMRPSMTKVVQMLEGLCIVPKPPKSSNYRDISFDSYLSAVSLSGPR